MTSSFLICVDASLVVPLFVDPPSSRIVDLWAGWNSAAEAFSAPTLIYYEVTNALYRYGRAGHLTYPAVEQALETALALPIELHGESNLHREATLLARQFNLPASYDAHYLALAARLGISFWTADRRLAQAVASDLPWVHLAS